MSAKQENKSWFGRGAWAVMDQGLFALANVLLNLLLARWLTPAEYGGFAVAYSLFLFVGALHTSLLTEPMLIFGAGKYARETRTYLRTLTRGHWVLTVVGSLLLITAGSALLFADAGSLALAIFSLGLATPFSLLMWFARRAAYLRFQPRSAAAASALYLALLLAGLFALAGLHVVSIFSATIAVGAAGAVAGLWLLHRVKGP